MSDNPQLIFTHPEMARRYDLLIERMWARSWDVGITSSTRSNTQQREWFRLFLNGQFPNLVADPDRWYCMSPWGWVAYGSMHMIQHDGYSHALDLHWTGCRADQMAAEAFMCGLLPVEPSENWHYQWWDHSGIFPVYADTPPRPPEPMEEDVMPDYILRYANDHGQPWLAIYPEGTVRWIGGGEAGVLINGAYPDGSAFGAGRKTPIVDEPSADAYANARAQAGV